MKLSELALPPWFSNMAVRHITYGILIGFTLSVTSTSISSYWRSRRRQSLSQEQFELRPIELGSDEVLHGVTGLIGNTPLVRINSLSDALGVEILGKAEFMNPGGSVKDRVALRIIEDAERQGLLYPHTGSRIFEGTVGSTGISIATIAKARGYDTTIIMPDDVALEKVNALQALGADVRRVRPASIVDKKQYVNIARRAAIEFGRSDIVKNLNDAHISHELQTGSPSVVVTTTSSHVHAEGTVDDPLDEDLLSKPRGFFADQFENRSNFEAHYDGTGPEIWRQTNGHVDAFVSGAGTGGTIAGIGRFLKSMDDKVQVVLADPEGSGLYNKVKHGVMYDRREAEGTKRRHQVDTVVEGIGINRMTNNIDLALPIIDDAFRITDVEAVAMSRYLVQNDGLFLGSSSACNLVACIKFAKKKGWREGQTLITILCDSGNRHYSKFWNDDYLHKANIPMDRSLIDVLIAQPDSGGFSPQ
ncbi:tryptophan synthase beta subunit-like PLP-dependent enzyme [Suillus paluster]|uniref:tryptophan synthase beta subunit-like PLP-dependent enzyme n=1 Tax=Suillus paluster TaxID=48578 RepID=UPI001B873CE7|nr:tryptophan synthase beta subunit-like PLP-dependent enzyme [Suillus paluster]KAG1751268.1 tryptophan synthase beta subunit-like PLP-dependent enzyme [Suillus paluster]